MRSSLSRSPVSLLAPLLVAAVETAVAAPMLALFDALADRDDIAPEPAPIVLPVIGLIAFILAGNLQRRDAGLRTLQAALLGGATVVAILAPIAQQLGSFWNPTKLSVVIVAAVFAVIAWWRGMQYASDPEPFGAERMNTLVKVAWVALVAQVLIVATVDSERAKAAEDALRIALPVAAVAGLVLLALGQIEQARINAARRGGRAPERRGWLVYAIVFAIGLLLIAGLASAVLGDDAARLIFTPLALLLRATVFVLTWTLIGIAVVFFVIFWPVMWLLRKLRGEPAEPQEQQQEGNLGNIEQIVNDGSSGLPEGLQQAVQIGAVVLIIVVVLVLLAITMRRVRRPAAIDTDQEERESLWSRDLALSQLKGLFRRGHEHDGLDRIDLKHPPHSVREAYRALQALAQRNGIPRRASETPSEFGKRLAMVWSTEAGAIADLTRRYEQVRYGGAPDEPGLAEARRAWSVILNAHAPE